MTDLPGVGLLEDVLDGLGQGEGLARAVGPDDEHRGQADGQGRSDGQDGLLLLGIQTRIQLLVPLPVTNQRDTCNRPSLIEPHVATC